ncbi:MAG: prepilin peptidase [Alistipes sp.]|nr:prepilin peptidase [Alistipes sp.]
MKILYILEILFLIIETVKDIKTQTLELGELLFFLAAGFLLRLFWFHDDLGGIVLGMSVGMILLGISFLSGEALGYGDGMVVLVTGVFCGIKITLVTIGIAFLVMSVLAICVFIKKGFYYKTKVPFVPCILAGFLGGMLL